MTNELLTIILEVHSENMIIQEKAEIINETSNKFVTKNINLNIINGRFIKDKNTMTKMDTYCTIEIGSYVVKTNTCKRGGK